eukprot:2813042-Amphidinium_carterae.1
MAFGLKSAVVNFNRFPALLIAALHRVFAVLCWHFFDDAGYIQFAAEEFPCQASELVNFLFDAV